MKDDKDKVPQDVTKYQDNYSEDGFWDKVSQIVKVGGKKVLEPALLLYYVLQSDTVPLKIKTAIIGALGYLILPLDLLPDFIPVAGYTDDVAAMVAIVKMCSDYITPEMRERAQKKLDELIH